MSRPETIEAMVELFKQHHLASHLFKIDNFSLLKKHGINDCESSIFEIGGYKWKLIIYPNGDDKDYGTGHVSLYVEMQTDPGVLPCHLMEKLKIKLFAVNQFRRVWRAGTVVSDVSGKKWGAARLISHAILEDTTKGFMVDDCVLLGVKFLGAGEGAKVGTADCFSLIEKPPNNKVTWKITKFSTFLNQKESKSNEFVTGNRRWRIQLSPRGFGEGQGNSLSVFLRAEGYTADAAQTKTYAKFRIRLLNQITRQQFVSEASYWFSVEPQSWGFQKLMTLKDLHHPSKGYLMNDAVYVGVEFDVVSITKPC